MATEFPMFTYDELRTQSGLVAIWRGCVQPIQPRDAEARLLLDDLSHDRPVYQAADEIRHLPGCTERHCEHAWMNQDLNLGRRFDLHLKYTGGEALPRCYVLSPTLEKLKHTWADGAICAFMDSNKNWRRGVDTVADFIPHVLIWLVKWMVFDATEVWIGSEHYSAPGYHLEFLHRNDLCWCGSGLVYRRCHRIQDQIDAGLAPPKKLLRASAIQNLRWLQRH
ncbi:MAG TPA: SEC-C metal-binding domain-containing protein [Candidatus Angelobacter sp.]|nr:SEC-C metal-binding domain-containing protein [Candidatus Angelobacter sp.]